MKAVYLFIYLIPFVLSAQNAIPAFSKFNELGSDRYKVFSPQSVSENNHFKISFTTENTYIHDHNSLVKKIKYSDSQFEVYGGGGDDILEVDLNGAQNMNIYYDGENNLSNTRGDILILTSMNQTSSIHTFYNNSDGKIIVGSNKIIYRGLEPVIDNLNVTDRIFNYTGGTETITFGEDINPDDGYALLESNLAESVQFLYPTNSLSINAGSGDDIVNVNGLDMSMVPPTISIDGGMGTNSLIVDALGVEAIDNGTSVTLNGLYTINYSNFDSVTIINLPAPVPTLSEWGLIILLLSFLLFGTIALKSNSKKKIYINRTRV